MEEEKKTAPGAVPAAQPSERAPNLADLAEEKAADALAASRTTEENAEALLDELDRQDPLPAAPSTPEQQTAPDEPAEPEEPPAEPPAETEQTETPAEVDPAEAPAETEETEPPTEAEPEEAPAEAEPEEAPAEAEPESAEAPEPADEPEQPEAPEPAEQAEPSETAEPSEPAAPAQSAEPAASAGQPEETPADTPDDTAAPSDVPADAETDAEADAEPEPPEISEEQRISDMSRTVQLSIEKILASAEAQAKNSAPAEPDEPSEETPPAADTPAEEEPEAAPTLRDHVGNALSGIGKWLLLVVFFVLLIACGGVAWLYRSATADMLPQVTVTFAGQEVAPTAYRWKVPVVGDLFKRTYAETLNTAPTALEQTVQEASPDLLISDSEYDTQFTVTDSEQEVLFDGTLNEFTSYRFSENGTYTGKLVISGSGSQTGDVAGVTGSETWLFTFTIAMRPSMTLATDSAAPGSVAAVRVGTTLSGETPTIGTELENVGFVKAANGWICYLPIPWDQAAGTVDVQVTADGCTEDLRLTITAADRSYADYSTSSQRVSPYIGADDAPAEVKALLETADEEIAWSGSGFVQPFLTKYTTPLTYGMTEYVGRTYQERKSNTGAGGRTSTNTVVKADSGGSFIAPASGTVLLAADLGGDYGNTLVIDHGAGLKSIFYGLRSLDVKKGDKVKQGQLIAVCNRYTVCEMRIGTVPIDAVNVWRGQCGGLKYY